MAARSGMADLITTVRRLASAGTADYTVAGETYWSDDYVQDALDQARTELFDEPLHPVTEYDSGGTARYYEYRAPFGYFEQTTGGTAVWKLRDANYATLGTADYTVDYLTGHVTFAADQAGSVRYLTARSYDVYAAAAMIWESKAAHVADRYDFTADGASFKASQLVDQYAKQAQRMWSKSTTGGMTYHRIKRDDMAIQW